MAITRAVSRSIIHCELTHLERVPIDFEKARRQHQAYEEALRSLGVRDISLPEEPDLPDSVFVEDTAVVLDECAVLTRPGADSRKPEVESIARALAPYRPLFRITAPATLDGGDVLVVDKRIFIGLTSRSNQAAIEQMQTFLAPYGYTVTGVPVNGCLHLKSAVTQAAEMLLLINPAWVEKAFFPGLDVLEIDPSEPYAANILRIGEQTIYQPAFPKTLARLRATGIDPILVDASELGKAEGALTCCSLIFQAAHSGTFG
ncbi:MAG: arginine deiminase-related protein [Anaerolineales bacterium]|nr:arginine deiminase-related protein [Anaerolineales bacterium]